MPQSTHAETLSLAASASSVRRVLATNAVANWVGFAAQAVVAFILSPLLLHGLGDQRFGIWSLLDSILAYLMLFDLGVAASVVRYVARFEATQDRERLNRIFSTSICIFAVAGAGALVIALAIAFSGAGLLRIPSELMTEARWMLVLLGANLAIGLPLSVFPAVLDGLGRYPAKTAIRTACLVLKVPVFLAVLRADGKLIELAWAITACNLVEHAALVLAARRYLPELRFRLALADRETFRTIRGYSLDAFLAMLAGRISFQTDAIVIGAFLAPRYITFFAVAARLVEYAKNSLRALTTVLTPAVSALEAQGHDEAIRQVLLNSTRYVLWLILPIQIGLLILGKPFLSLWLGPEYADTSYRVLVILALPLALTLSQSVSGRILYGTGQLRWFARATMAEALANLLLSVALVRRLGIEGVAWGTTIPNVVFNLAVAVYICRTLHVGLGTYARRSFLSPVAAACLLAIAWVAAATWIPLTSWAALVLTGACGVAGYLSLAIIVECGPMAVMAYLKMAVGLTSPSEETG